MDKKILLLIPVIIVVIAILFSRYPIFYKSEYFACNPPNVIIEEECCLDENENNICDTNEARKCIKWSYSLNETENITHNITLINETIDNTSVILEINESQIEQEIFDRINIERGKRGLAKLDWNKKLADLARKHSWEMGTNGYYSHIDLNEKDAAERAYQAGIYVPLVTENLHLLEGITPDFEISRTIVGDWMKNLLEKRPMVDIDRLYSEAGIGIFCEGNVCFTTGLFIQSEIEYNYKFAAKYSHYLYLFDPIFDFPEPANISFNVTSDYNMEVYVVPSRNEYDKFILGNAVFDHYAVYYQVKNASGSFSLDKGSGLILYSRSPNNNIKANLKFPS